MTPLPLRRGLDGRLKLRLSDSGDQKSLEEFARLLQEKHGAVLLGRAAGLDQAYWDYLLQGAKVTLHREHYLGISLLAESEAGERALRAVAGPGELELRDARPGDEAGVQALVRAVMAEYGLKPACGFHDDLKDLGKNYGARGGVFKVLVSEAGEITGCGGLYPLSPEEGEIRKMYLLKAFRGRGRGRALLEELIAAALAAGRKRVVLETASVLKEAISLYRSRGFVPVPRTGDAACCDQAFVLDLTSRV